MLENINKILGKLNRKSGKSSKTETVESVETIRQPLTEEEIFLLLGPVMREVRIDFETF